MEITRISSKGQVVIPSKIRAELNFGEGSVLVIEKVGNVVMIKKIEEDLLKQIRNSLEDIKYGRIKEWKG